MMYVPKKFQMKSSQDIFNMVSKFNKDDPTWYELLMIDYFYYHHQPNYDGGLSFLDRLNKKIGHLHPDWNIEDLKIIIETANNPSAMYVDVIEYMINDPNDIKLYGI